MIHTCNMEQGGTDVLGFEAVEFRYRDACCLCIAACQTVNVTVMEDMMFEDIHCLCSISTEISEREQ